MHIPDNYLSPQTCAVMAGVMIPVWTISIKKIREDLSKTEIPKMGVGAAFSFLGMMFNIPLPGGTTGHAVGGTLISLLLGPYAACIAVSVALFLQALIFGDGGILSFGANCFNMAFVLPFVGYAVSKIIVRHSKNTKRQMLGAAVGSYVGINAAAFCAAVEFGIQPMLFRDAAGNAMYCPYGLNIAIPSMMLGHLTLFGAAEVIYTVLVLSYVKKADPKMASHWLHADGTGEKNATGKKTSLGIRILLGTMILLTPIGLLAEGTAWGEWSTDEIAKTGAAFTPQGMLQGISYKAFLPDYSVTGIPEWAGYILSAVMGVALLIIIFKMASQIKSSTKKVEIG